MVVVAAMFAAAPASAWVRDLIDERVIVWSIAAFDNGDVVACGTRDNGETSDLWVRKLRGSDGKDIWEWTFDGTGHSSDIGYAVEVDAAGDVIVAARTYTSENRDETVVFKLSANGTERWRSSPSASGVRELENVILSGGTDVVVISRFSGYEYRWYVAKLRGRDGQVSWSYSRGEVGPMTAAVAAADGSVFLSGEILGSPWLVRLDGSTGTPVWTKKTQLPSTINGLWAMGEDILATATNLARLAGDDGHPKWSIPVNTIAALAVDAAGDTGVVGTAAFRKLRGSDGGEVWRTPVARLGPAAVRVARNDFFLVGDFVGDYAMRIDGRSGNRIWSIDDVHGVRDIPVAFRVTPAGDPVIATGTATITKLSGSDGSSFASCAGDCDHNGAVTVDELLLATGRALEGTCCECAAVDTNSDNGVTVDEIVAAVERALTGCPS